MKRFGKYLLERQLAIGGMAEIFLARQHGPAGFEKTLVIKRILPHFANDETFITMFLDEARTSAKLNHPNLVQIYELGETEGSYYIAMELIRGESLSKVIKRLKKYGMHMPLHLAAKIIASTCAGLDYAHNFRNDDGESLNLVHRDISPDNILVSFDGAVKMIDFGIAKARENESKTQVGSVKGKFCYMSPEQVTGKRLDRRSDIFSLGIVLHELTTLAKPFGDGADFLTVSAIVNDEPRTASDFLEGYPAPLWDIISRTLTKDRDERYQNAHELQIALEKFIHSRGEFLSDRDIGAYLRKLFSEKDDDISELREMASGIRTRIIIPATGETGDGPETVIEPSGGVAETIIAQELPSDTTGRQPSVGATPKAKNDKARRAAAAIAAQGMAAQASAATMAVPQLGDAEVPPKPAQKTSKKSGPGLWIGLVLLLAALAAGGWFGYQHWASQGDGPTDPSPQPVAVGTDGNSGTAGADGTEGAGTDGSTGSTGTDGTTNTVAVASADAGVAAAEPDAGVAVEEPDASLEGEPDVATAALEEPDTLVADSEDADSEDADSEDAGADADSSVDATDTKLDGADGTISEDAAIESDSDVAAIEQDTGTATEDADTADALTPAEDTTVDGATDASVDAAEPAVADTEIDTNETADAGETPADAVDTSAPEDAGEAPDAEPAADSDAGSPPVDSETSETLDTGEAPDSGGQGAAVAPVETGVLKIYSKAKVKIYIDGKSKGYSPLTLTLPVGNETVHAKGSGIDNYFKIKIEAGKTAQLHVPQPAKKGKLVFKISKKYRIKVGSKKLAPGTRVYKVPLGRHRITITDPENPSRTAIKTVTVRAGKPTVVSL
ncbi:MAG: serine/threonine protein kinase [Myxococcota bacterium]